MADSSMQQSAAQIHTISRSLGLKLIVVCGLAVLMAVPGLFVGGLVEDRTRRAADVVQEISAHAGGPQSFLGPVLAIPYTIPPEFSAGTPTRDVWLVFPATGSAVLRTVTQERHRSLFKVPVYQADVKLDASFDLNDVTSAAPPRAKFDWNRAEIVVGVSNAHGALADGMLTVNGKTTTLVPAEIAPDIVVGGDPNGRLMLALFGARVEGLAKPNARFDVTSSLQFSGARRIAVLAYGKTTHLSAEGDWPNPGFDGGFLPVRRTVTTNGFRAEWSVPFIARGVRAEGRADTLGALDATALGTSFIEVADPYQSVSRSEKYLLLFVGLIFLSYFVLEVSTRRRVHPAQYILVGIAQIIFYLLLLSLAERIGFDWAFFVAGGATVALLSINAGWVFASRVQGLKALAIFSLLYTLIYLLLRVEDNALLVGATASFVAVAVTMYLTRRIDWYSPLGAAQGTVRPIGAQDPSDAV